MLLLTPSYLLCTYFLVSPVVCLDFSLGCSCKETASCGITLGQPKRGRDATSPEILGSCCGAAGTPQCPHQLLLPCHTSCLLLLLLFFSSFHHYLPGWTSGTRWAAGAGGSACRGALKTPLGSSAGAVVLLVFSPFLHPRELHRTSRHPRKSRHTPRLSP